MSRSISIVCLLLAMSLPALAQNAPPPSDAPSPAEKAPLSTTTDPDPSKKPGGSSMPAPDKSLALPSPGAASTGATASPTLQTLVPEPADPGEPDQVSLPAKPAIILTTKAKKEELLTELKSAFERLGAELSKAGVKPAGRPLAFFVGDDDDVMRFEAMIPVTAAPAQPPALAEGMKFGSTPSGKAYRFKHAGSYDAIVRTYEVLTTYLDLKDVAVQDPFVEEYVTDLRDDSDEKLDVNIYALKK